MLISNKDRSTDQCVGHVIRGRDGTDRAMIKQKIIKLYTVDKITVADIAVRMGVSSSHVSTVLRQHGHNPKKDRSKQYQEWISAVGRP